MKKIFVMAAVVLAMAAMSSCSGSGDKGGTNDSSAADSAKQEQVTDADAVVNEEPIGDYKDGVCVVSNQQAFKSVVLDAKPETPVFIDFGATWCGPCKQFKPVFEEVANVYADRAQFYTVDIDECPNLTNQLNIEGVPTLIVLYKDGSKAKYVGTGDILPKEKFEAIVQKAINQ